MLRSVMVPADFSDDFGLVARFAEGLTTLGVRRAVLGHVVEASGMEGPIIASKVDRVRGGIWDLTRGLCASGIECEVRVSTGDDPARELLAMAAESHVGGVVMGTHGKGPLEKLIDRSVSEEVVWHASVPVLLVRFTLLRNREHPAEVAHDFARQIIVPVDFSASSLRAYTALLELPASAIGTAYLLHAVDPTLSGRAAKRAEQGAEFQLRNMARMAEEAKIVARPVIRRGDPAKVILQETDERRATGIVAGTRGANPIAEAVLGSASMTLIRQASCPVMVVP